MKRRFAKGDNEDSLYIQKRIDKDYFSGYACKKVMGKVDNPIKVKVEDRQYYILNDNYTWYLIYPDNANYAITIMYDDNNNLLQWYFDIAKEVGVENGIPYEDDLYLDLVIGPNGESIVLDEDELKDALDKKNITIEDYKLAYKTLGMIQNEYADNFDHLVALTDRIEKEFSKKKVI